jgi:hypothetical protein
MPVRSRRFQEALMRPAVAFLLFVAMSSIPAGSSRIAAARGLSAIDAGGKAAAVAGVPYVSHSPAASTAAPAPLDYEYFKTMVQPIFLAKRPGHARCIACHTSGTPLRLQPLSPGHATWTDEESAKNFQAVRRVVVPGSLKSRLLLHPLDEQAGGDFYHSGGKHWTSQDDAEWQTLKTWVLGQTGK